MPPTFGHAMLEHWAFEPGLTYLNHGTVGAPPRRVIAAQQAIRDAAERNPARFQLRELADVKQIEMRMEPRMRTAAAAVAAFVNARADDVVFVDNATSGINAVMRSLKFAAGDEILITDLGYGAIERGAHWVAERAGAAVRVVELAPPFDSDAIVATIAAALGPRTKLAILDHVTAGTALVLPAAELAARCRAAGVPVLLDGAHVPGALPLDIPAIGADWYVGNLHKWAMAPRSCAFLWAAPERQAGLHPPVISWGYQLGFTAEFDLPGTRDASPMLAAPEGLAFMRDLGLDAMRAWNHAIAWDGARTLADRWGVRLPMREAHVGSMAAMILPERFGTTGAAMQRMKDALLYEDGIEAQLHGWKGRGWLRLSGQVYVEPADIEKLARAMEARA